VVIHFDLPLNVESYLHRVGRSTPFYSKGTSICFVTPADQRGLREIEQHHRMRVEEMSADVVVFIKPALD